MKKVIKSILVLVSLVFSTSSCNKEYTCECTDTNGIGGDLVFTTETYRWRNAQDACSRGSIGDIFKHCTPQ